MSPALVNFTRTLFSFVALILLFQNCSDWQASTLQQSNQESIIALSALRCSASGTYEAQIPALAFDRNPNTYWNSGQNAGDGTDSQSSPYIECDLGGLFEVRHLRLQLAQYPSGPSRHELWTGTTSEALTLDRSFSTFQSDGQWIEISRETGSEPIRYVRIVTAMSPSWVAWRELQFYGKPSAAAAASQVPQACLNLGINEVNPRYYGYLGPNSSTNKMNTRWVETNDSASLQIELRDAATRGQAVVLSLIWHMPEPFTPGAANPSDWLQYSQALKPFLANIVAFYIADEPPINDPDVKLRIERNIQMLKEAYPEVPIATAYRATDIDKLCSPNDSVKPQFSASCDPNAALPRGLDWVGFDAYFQGLQNLTGPSNLYTFRLTRWLEQLESNLTSEQKVILFPDAAIHVPYSEGSVASANEHDVEVMKQYAAWYFRLAQSDAKIVGLFPFHWGSFREGDIYWWGARDLPESVALQQRQFGACLEYQ